MKTVYSVELEPKFLKEGALVEQLTKLGVKFSVFSPSCVYAYQLNAKKLEQVVALNTVRDISNQKQYTFENNKGV